MYLGLDLGTSGLKAQVINEKRKVVFESTETFDFIKLPNGATEQDANLWVKAVKKIFNHMPVEIKKEIKAISFSGQMHGSVFVDSKGDVIRNVILWNDQRTVAEVEYLNNKFPINKILDKTGNVFLTGFTAPKVLWLKNNEPDNFKKINKVLLPKDYLIFLFSGEYATDYSDAIGTSYLNIKLKTWDQEILEELGIEDEQLPKLFNSSDVVGNINKDVAKMFGLNFEVKIIAGGGDNPIGAIGMGMVQEGDISCSFGTSGVVYSPTEELRVDKIGRTHSFISATSEYYLMGVSLSTASSLNWMMGNILESKDFDALFGLEMFERNITDIIFTPYLNGERTPHFDPKIRAAFLNMSIYHDKIDLTRSILEGVIFSMKDSLNILIDCGVKPKNIYIQGGITNNQFFNQLVADIFGMNVVTGKSANGPAYGAALVAFAGANKIDLKRLSKENISIGNEYKPRENFVDLYAKKYEEFKLAYNRTK